MPVTPYGPRHAAPHPKLVKASPESVPEAGGEEASRVSRLTALGSRYRRAARRSLSHLAPLHLSQAQLRKAAIGAIGAGVALFVATSVASAASQHPAAARPVALGTPHAMTSTSSAAAGGAGSAPAVVARAVGVRGSDAGAARLTDRPVRSKTTAPATTKVIQGLAANGIPNVALNAYRVAATRMQHVLPSCGVDWALLAGIGREESDHGRFGGAVLNADGTSTPRIIGPALDGTHSEYIAAPANGFALDGDALYTHALGPMQFIPQTWAAYGTDADGDGQANIFDINDAALTAARYLCAAGGNLRTHAGQVAAVLAYNHSTEYLAQVLALAAAYRAGTPVSGLPVGNLTGTLPPITSVVPTLGANPGGPTAVQGLTPGSGSGAPKPGTSTRRSGSPTSGTSSTHPAAGTTTTKAGTTKTGTGGTAKPTSATPTTTSPKPTAAPTSSASTAPQPVPTLVTTSPAPSPTCKLSVVGTCVVN